MNTDLTHKFAVVLRRPEQREPMALAKALAAVRKTPLQDQMMEAKNGWGIVADHLEEPLAQTLCEALKSGGIECTVVPAASLAVLPEVQMVKRFEPGWTEGLLLVAAAGLSVTSTTTRVEHQGPSTGEKLLSAGILMTTGLPIKIGPKEEDIKKKQSQTDLVFYADLLYSGQPRRLRVDAQHFDYSFLKERRLYQVMGNFKLLLDAAVNASPQVGRNHGVKILLAGLPVSTMGYRSLADLERETRWLLTLQRLGV